MGRKQSSDSNFRPPNKFEAANEAGVSLKDGYNGELTAKQAGKIGGAMGGSMVGEMVKMAEQSLSKKKQ